MGHRLYSRFEKSEPSDIPVITKDRGRDTEDPDIEISPIEVIPYIGYSLHMGSPMRYHFLGAFYKGVLYRGAPIQLFGTVPTVTRESRRNLIMALEGFQQIAMPRHRLI